MKTIEEIKPVLKGLEERVRKEYNAEIIGFFGSYARQQQKKSSDLDILVRFEEGATLFDLVGLADFLEDQLHIRVDIVPVDAIRKELKDSIIREAIYL